MLEQFQVHSGIEREARRFPYTPNTCTASPLSTPPPDGMFVTAEPPLEPMDRVRVTLRAVLSVGAGNAR